MVKKLTFLTLLLAIAAFAVVPAMAQSTTATPDVTADAGAQANFQANATANAPLTASTGTFVTSRFLVNVRSGPGLQYTIIGKLRSGDAVDVTGMYDPLAAAANTSADNGTNNANNGTGSTSGSTTGSDTSGTGNTNNAAGNTTGNLGNSTTSNPNRAVWLRINFNGQEGWVSSTVVTFTGDMTTLQAVQPGETAVLRNGQNNGQNANNNQSLSDVVVITRFNTNLRQSFSTSSELLATIPFSTTLNILGRSQDNRWLRVSYNGQTGWVSSGLVAFNRGSINSLPIFDEAGNLFSGQVSDQNQASATAQATSNP
jgi:uncharacterized protein YgiM (DUF1202 family)